MQRAEMQRAAAAHAGAGNGAGNSATQALVLLAFALWWYYTLFVA